MNVTKFLFLHELSKITFIITIFINFFFVNLSRLSRIFQADLKKMYTQIIKCKWINK